MPLTDQMVIHTLEFAPNARVEAWFVPALGVDSDHPSPAVIFFHGNAELIDYQDHIVRRYHAMGISVLLPEYRGYGLSGGTPSQEGIRSDCVKFYDWLIQRPGVDASRIVFHGSSLGGGVACDLATQREPAALILQSTFASVASMAHGYGVPSFLAKHPFRNDLYVAGSDVPKLIFHGCRDEIIPIAHGRKLRDLAPNALYIEYDCGHNDWPGRSNTEAAWGAIRSFLVGAGIVPE